ncbi:hypothetical protein K435DRAFT_855754 [Dendrothele bispora CBS 962.96]|uniref:Uncharacterized protein n=1 Tax=Dendrothele bispora (strain CBS 962.96) TaxID=1314807 RepID=A0A4S8MA85_DENBC|nr:hypothetical protein K435DRAFT_855754 [Dendrothele bispora CBS 962.96]
MSIPSSVVLSISSPSFSLSSDDHADPARSRSSTVSTQSFSLVAGESDDEIVWAISSEYQSSSDASSTESSTEEEDDFIVLSRPRSPSGVSTPLHTSNLNSTFSNLSVNSAATSSSDESLVEGRESPRSRRRGPKREKKHAAKPSPSTPVESNGSLSTKPISNTKKRWNKKGKKQTAAVVAVGLGARPIVDDVSERLSECAAVPTEDSSVYDEAVNYITSFLSNPSAHDDSHCRLTLLQSLIIELGIVSRDNSLLPATITTAKAMLKSHAFLNVREYLSVRDQGPKAIQQVMYPSRSALIKSIRKKPKGRASREWVKNHGLSVLLVSCFH